MIALFWAGVFTGVVCVPPKTTCEQLAGAQLGFVATVITGSESGPKLKRPARVRIERVVKGEIPLMEYGVDSDVSSSGFYRMQAGERWLVLGRWSRDGKTVISTQYEGSRLMDETVERILEARALRRTLIVGELEFERSRKPVAGVAVEVRQSDAIWAATSDDQGRFLFWDLGPGKLQVSFAKQGLSAEQPEDTERSRYAKFVHDEYRLEAMGCVQVNVALWPDNEVMGQVVHGNGSPARGVRVEAMPTDSRESLTRYTQTDEEGRFVLRRLSSGAYLVSAAQYVEESQYTVRTYHPGGWDRSAARRIEVRGDSKIRDIDIRLKD